MFPSVHHNSRISLERRWPSAFQTPREACYATHSSFRLVDYSMIFDSYADLLSSDNRWRLAQTLRITDCVRRQVSPRDVVIKTHHDHQHDSQASSRGGDPYRR